MIAEEVCTCITLDLVTLKITKGRERRELVSEYYDSPIRLDIMQFKIYKLFM